jgi:uncharacterized protein (TIGR02145 family)
MVIKHLSFTAAVKIAGILLFVAGTFCNDGNPVEDINTLVDADGNVYTTVKIGNQEWMVENLRTTKYNDGSDIPLVEDDDEWYNISLSDNNNPAYCFYYNTTDSDSIKKYGALYNWYAVNTGKLAPVGWHVPTEADWDTLQSYLITNGYNWDGTKTDNKIGKSLASRTDWISSIDTGDVGNDLITNNSTGFTAYPGGCRGHNGFFCCKGDEAIWWSSTEGGMSNRYGLDRYVNYGIPGFGYDLDAKEGGYSVRLVKDN